ncbi:hypothetical protein [Allorhizobium taibaishanense]|uniref:Uncharacterized protein n=1 Tax=Allorhizobium taibaishanense TaxID=887144 RepID=A0A7W6HLY3_9HYPH|nr:hypothetical protein [Allorhizobium taibaishanense]MBB4007408.1 hypothetical protein [Allorhizobium taibaishanense]
MPAPAVSQTNEPQQPVQAPIKLELSDNYGPIGLKAVIAASLMLQRKAKKVA